MANGIEPPDLDSGQLVDQLALLFEIDANDVYEHWAGGEFDALEAEVGRDPDALAAAALADPATDIEVAVEQLVHLAQAWPVDTARGLLAAIASLGVRPAGAMVRAAIVFDDLPSLVPAGILVAAADSSDVAMAWAGELLDDIVRRWQWPEIARQLDASAALGMPASWMSEALDAQAWAAKDPVPDVNLPGGVELPSLELDRARLGYDAIFAAGDIRVVRAASEARLVASTARAWRDDYREPEGWLGMLGTSLPGCGEPTCCRPGLFEVELMRLGFYVRACRYPPDLSAPQFSKAEEEAGELYMRTHPPEPPGPNFWKTVFRWFSRFDRDAR